MLQDAADPDACRDRIPAMNAHLFAFEIFGITNAGFRVVHDGAVMKNARRKDRYRRKPLSIRLRADVSRHRQFADVKLQPTYHPAECLNQDRNIDVIDLEGFWFDGLIPQGLRVSIRTKDGFQLEFSHRVILSVLSKPRCSLALKSANGFHLSQGQ